MPYRAIYQTLPGEYWKGWAEANVINVENVWLEASGQVPLNTRLLSSKKGRHYV